MDTIINRENGYTSVREDDKEHAYVHGLTLSDLGKQKNILVVDDSESIIELLSVLLHNEGTVSTAINGLDALSKFACKNYDCIISDIEMPLMNGIDLYEYVIRINPKYKKRFLFFSGTTNEQHTSYLSMNNLTLLIKPHDINRLQLVVHQYLQDESTDNTGNMEAVNKGIDTYDI
jgi:DNA-binding NtrC family response regulator